MTRYVLDASALLAYLSDEAGASEMEKQLQTATCMSAVNWGEVVSKTSDLGKNPDQLRVLLREPGATTGKIRVFPFTLEDAWLLAKLRPVTRKQGLSLGDRACLALALRLTLPVLTADRLWTQFELPIKIKLIR
jgi:ribonuclease VapC